MLSWHTPNPLTGEPLTPQAGQVVQWNDDGRWELIADAYSCSTPVPREHLMDMATPILPAPGDGTAWDALEAFLPWERPTMGAAHLHLERGLLYRFFESGGKQHLEYQAASIQCEREAAKVVADVAKVRVILAWLAQWPGGER
jgi:hypothetical protein